jgi:hypothetical protein
MKAGESKAMARFSSFRIDTQSSSLETLGIVVDLEETPFLAKVFQKKGLKGQSLHVAYHCALNTQLFF